MGWRLSNGKRTLTLLARRAGDPPFGDQRSQRVVYFFGGPEVFLDVLVNVDQIVANDPQMHPPPTIEMTVLVKHFVVHGSVSQHIISFHISQDTSDRLTRRNPDPS